MLFARYEVFIWWMSLPKEVNLLIIFSVMVVFTAIAEKQARKK